MKSKDVFKAFLVSWQSHPTSPPATARNAQDRPDAARACVARCGRLRHLDIELIDEHDMPASRPYSSLWSAGCSSFLLTSKMRKTTPCTVGRACVINGLRSALSTVLTKRF